MDLFTSINYIKIEILNEFDCIYKSDKYQLFKKVLTEHESQYPNIIQWFDKKVVPGIRNKSRIAYLGINDGLPIATAILKIGNPSKFCHLHIIEPFRHSHLGELFFSMMALDAYRKATTIYFSLPESLWETEKSFFKSFSFNEVETFSVQYRKGDKELVTKSSFDNVWNEVLTKLPKIITNHTNFEESIFSGLLLSIKPTYADLIFSNKKLVEIRKRFSSKYIGSRVTLYSTAPRKELSGYAKIRNVIKANPKEIWERYQPYIAASYSDYRQYVGNNNEVNAILLENVEKYKERIPISQVQYWLGKNLIVPQSHLDLSSSKDWQTALSLAEMLQRRFLSFTRFV